MDKAILFNIIISLASAAIGFFGGRHFALIPYKQKVKVRVYGGTVRGAFHERDGRMYGSPDEKTVIFSIINAGRISIQIFKVGLRIGKKYVDLLPVLNFKNKFIEPNKSIDENCGGPQLLLLMLNYLNDKDANKKVDYYIETATGKKFKEKTSNSVGEYIKFIENL